MVVRAGLRLWGDPPLNITVTSAILLGSGILLILGLWTPIVGISVAVIEAWKMLTLPGDRWLWLVLGAVSGALAMLTRSMVDRRSRFRVEACQISVP